MVKGLALLGLLAGLVMVCGAGAARSTSPAVTTFQTGDLIVGTDTGLQWLHADGSLVKTLDDGFGGVPGPLFYKAAFAPSGQLWMTPGECCGADFVVDYDSSGNLLGPIVDPFDATCGNPTDISFDGRGNAYIGDFGVCFGSSPTFGAKKFSATGQFLGVAIPEESDGVDLARDQCTLYIQDEEQTPIVRKNVCNRSPAQAIFATCTGEEPRGFRILPDGSLLSAEPGLGEIVNVPGTPTTCTRPPLHTYDVAGCDDWYGVQLDVGGSSFWSTCFTTLTAYEFDVATGVVLRTLSTPGVVHAVFGGFRSALNRNS